jgi:hypothetical protein
VTKDIEQESQRPTAPQTLPETTPPVSPGHDYSHFIFQQIMEVQKTLGQLTQSVTILTDESKKQGDKIDKISHQVFAAKVILSIVGGALLLFSGLIGKLWDIVIPLLQTKPHP